MHLLGPISSMSRWLTRLRFVKFWGLETEPELRPACLSGYEYKLWGQYPALSDAPGSVVEGAVYHVKTVEHGERGLRHMKQKTTRLILVASAILMGRSPHTMSDIHSNSKGTRRIWVREFLTWGSGWKEWEDLLRWKSLMPRRALTDLDWEDRIL